MYLRVADLEDDACERRETLRQACRRKGYRIMLEVEDSATARQQPGRQRVLDAVAKGDVDAVIVPALHHIASNAPALLDSLQYLQKHRARFLAVSDGIDIRPTHDRASDLQLCVIRALATMERTRRFAPIRRGIERARRAGKRIGRPPVSRPPSHKVLALKAAGYTWQRIADTLGCTVWAARLAGNTSPPLAPRVPKPRR